MDIYPIPQEPVHDEAAENLEAGQSLPNEKGPVMTAPVIGFVHDGTVSRLLRFTGETKLGDGAWTRIGSGMDMDVAYTGENVFGRNRKRISI